jgi:mersacidin/lichenicidin family type 2 lantibiotic
MSKLDVIRVWKDAEYRSNLAASEPGEIPANPAGMIDLSDVELSGVAGGTEGVAYTGCVPNCTVHGCATFVGQGDLGQLTMCAILSALALCMCFGDAG